MPAHKFVDERITVTLSASVLGDLHRLITELKKIAESQETDESGAVPAYTQSLREIESGLRSHGWQPDGQEWIKRNTPQTNRRNRRW
jgi:hypothetical protein